MTPARTGWLPTSRCDSRTGAAHLRRGAPCQDASGLWRFRDAAGDRVQVLVVSDGHGGSRYVRSDVGSRLACEVALRTVERTLSTSRTGQAGSESEWRQWLAESLPQAIVEAWLEAVQRHWQAQGPQGTKSVPALAAGSADAPAAASPALFSPIPYGATLGLLVLTPRWWGHTGLGDWDLVRIEASGEGRLVSEEPEAGGGGEATYSLCMQGAARYFAPRSGLQPLAPEELPFSLLLSTDGIRKSCGTDADYLTLAHYLVELPQNDAAAAEGGVSELAAALDHISSQGSGDDVSVAIGRWGDTGQQRGRRKRGGSDEPLIVQPPPPQPSPAAVPVAVAPGQRAAEDAPAQREPAAAEFSRVGTSSVAAGISSRHGSPSGGRRSASPYLWSGVALLSLVTGGGLWLARWQGWGPFAAREPAIAPLTALQRQQLQRQVDLLCGQPLDGMAASGEAAISGGEVTRSIPASPAGERNAGRSDPLQTVQSPPQGLSQQRLAGHGSAAVLEASGTVPHGAQPPAQRLQAQPSKGHPSQGAGAGGDQRPHSALLEAPGPDRPAALSQLRGTLSNRRSTFRQILHRREPEVRALLASSATDSLGALIAWSRLDPSLAVGLPPLDAAELSGGGPRGIPWPRMPGVPKAEPGPDAPQLTLCPELRLELRNQWALSNPAKHPPGQGASGPRPSATGSAVPGPSGSRPSAAAPTPEAGRSNGSGHPVKTPLQAPTPRPSHGSGGQDSPHQNR